jgi:hypothetical protein
MSSSSLLRKSHIADGCRNIQEAKHQAITLDDVKEVMTAINRKHLVGHGSWPYGTSATPSRRTIARYFSFAAEEMKVKLSIGEVQAKTNTRYTAENSLMSAMSFLLVQAISGSLLASLTRKRSLSILQLRELSYWPIW